MNLVKKSIGQLKKTAWDLLSKIIRLTYADDGGTVECFTCGKLMYWKESQAGHAIPGRTGAVLLDEEILRPQCAGCNIFGRGMYHVYTTKLIKEKGLDWWECKLVESKKVRKWNKVELIEVIEGYKKRLERLTKES
jgi:hypothetical protein